MIFTTHNAEETYRFAQELGAQATPGMIVALEGDLGAGKTVFSQGFADGLGVNEPVNSPTFTIVQEYTSGRLPLYHFDVYRLDDPDELEEIGADEYFFGDGVCLIEWAGRIREILPEETLWIRIDRDRTQGDDVRILTLVEAGTEGPVAPGEGVVRDDADEDTKQ